MLMMLWLWCAAQAAPETVVLDNGVRVVTDTVPGASRLHVGWFATGGSASASPGATAMALTAHETTDRVAAWSEALGTSPELHLCARDAGSQASIDAADLEAWAWLVTDALARTDVSDTEALHAHALNTFPVRPTDGYDRAPTALSWPRVAPDAVPSAAAVTQALATLNAADGLVVVVRGDITSAEATRVLRPYFDHFQKGAAPEVPSVSRDATTTVSASGPDQVVLMADVSASPHAHTLVRTLDAHVGTALADVAFDARVHLVTDAPTWTVQLTATPAPGQAAAVGPAWTAWLQTLQGAGLPAAPPSASPTVLGIAHNTLFPAPAQGPDADTILAAMVGAPATIVHQTSPPEDPELDTLRRTLGDMTAELVRIRLRTLQTTPDDGVDAWMAQVRRERDAVAPRLRPAFDLLLARAQERTQ